MATKNAKPFGKPPEETIGVDYQAEGTQLPLAAKYPSPGPDTDETDEEVAQRFSSIDLNTIPVLNLEKRTSGFKRGITPEFLDTHMLDKVYGDGLPSRSTILPSNPPTDILNQIGITGNRITQPKSMPKSFIQFDLFPEMELESMIGFESHRHNKKKRRR